ncbi:MAG: hypothetical protein DRJ40_08245 [Thermoprotei archaeon]|nr:MAG: hypothetical protein DRJ40_08245 [Thermoprotei archaeon]
MLSAEKGIWVSMDRATASDLLSHARTKKIDVVNARVEHVSYATAKIFEIKELTEFRGKKIQYPLWAFVKYVKWRCMIPWYLRAFSSVKVRVVTEINITGGIFDNALPVAILASSAPCYGSWRIEIESLPPILYSYLVHKLMQPYDRLIVSLIALCMASGLAGGVLGTLATMTVGTGVATAYAIMRQAGMMYWSWEITAGSGLTIKELTVLGAPYGGVFLSRKVLGTKLTWHHITLALRLLRSIGLNYRPPTSEEVRKINEVLSKHPEYALRRIVIRIIYEYSKEWYEFWKRVPDYEDLSVEIVFLKDPDEWHGIEDVEVDYEIKAIPLRISPVSTSIDFSREVVLKPMFVFGHGNAMSFWLLKTDTCYIQYRLVDSTIMKPEYLAVYHELEYNFSNVVIRKITIEGTIARLEQYHSRGELPSELLYSNETEYPVYARLLLTSGAPECYFDSISRPRYHNCVIYITPHVRECNVSVLEEKLPKEEGLKFTVVAYVNILPEDTAVALFMNFSRRLELASAIREEYVEIELGDVEMRFLISPRIDVALPSGSKVITTNGEATVFYVREILRYRGEVINSTWLPCVVPVVTAYTPVIVTNHKLEFMKFIVHVFTSHGEKTLTVRKPTLDLLEALSSIDIEEVNSIHVEVVYS